MNYKALVFDLDGTAIPSTMDGLPSDLLIEEINKAKRDYALVQLRGDLGDMQKLQYKPWVLHLPALLVAEHRLLTP